MPRRRQGDGRAPAVCIVRHNYYPDSHVRRDAEALAGAGFAVSVVALRREGQPARERLDGVDVHRLPVRHRRGTPLRYLWEYSVFALLAFLRVGWLHLRRRFAVVEVDNMPDFLVVSALVPKLTGTPVIMYVFDNMPELYAYLWQVDMRHPLVRLLALQERGAYALADRVIVTQSLARRLALARGVPEHELTVVLNSADERIFTPAAPEARAATVGERDGVFRIVTHGTILERYGIQVLIDALPRVIAQLPEARVDVFGEGEYRAALERRVAELGLHGHVRFRGFVPLDELLSALRSADVGYVGMLNELCLPNKLMEYVALGIPVVTSRWPTLEQLFPDDSVAWFPAGDARTLADALVDVARDPMRARERARRASVRYQAYRWPVQREVYLGVYRELLGAGATTGVPQASRLPEVMPRYDG